MKFRKSVLITFNLVLIAALALPVQLAAQHRRNKVIDIGTFSGPAEIPTHTQEEAI